MGTMTNRWVRIAAALVVTATAGTAQAADTWSSPFPGIQHLHRTGPSKLNLHAAVVDLCAAGISVRHTAFEERKQKTSSFATAVGAQLAINADFSCRPIDVDPVKSPFKPCVNKPAYVTYGIAAHAGVPWPQTLAKDALLAFGNERAQIWDDAENKDFDPAWMQEVLSGHWSLVLDGKLTGADCPIDPRTGVGLSADGNKLILIVVDGRNGWKGMTCIEMAKVLIELGADRAFNLDGGGSSTFWQKGVGVLNHPSDGVERVVGPHLAIHAKGAGPSPHCERPSVLDAKFPLPPYVPQGQPGWLQTPMPKRIFDTRVPALAVPLQGLVTDAKGRMAGGTSASWGDKQLVPAGSSAVVLNLVSVEAAAVGFFTMWSGAAPMPNVSLLNYEAGVAAANMGPVPLGAKDTVAIFSQSPTHLIGDLQGSFGKEGAGFSPTTPYRALDTRTDDKPLLPGQPRKVMDGNPAVSAMALGITTVTPMWAGFLTVYPCDKPLPDTSNVNFAQGEARAAAVLAPMGTGGICVVASVPTHLLVDVFGTFAPKKGSPWQAVAPVRLVDTRLPAGRWTGKVQPGNELELRFADMPGFPADAVGVSFNLTAVNPRDDGFLSFGPCGKPAATSNLLFRENHNVASAAWMGLGANGSLCLKSFGRTHVLVDLNGVFLAEPAPPPDPVDAGPAENDAGTSASDGGQADAAGAPDAVADDTNQDDAGTDATADATTAGDALGDGTGRVPDDADPKEVDDPSDSASGPPSDADLLARDLEGVGVAGDPRGRGLADAGAVPAPATGSRDAGCSAGPRTSAETHFGWLALLAALATLAARRQRGQSLLGHSGLKREVRASADRPGP